MIGAHISPLISTSTHIATNPTRTRKLLLNMSEIEKLIGKTERSGYSLVPINLHFSKGRIKIDIGLANPMSILMRPLEKCRFIGTNEYPERSVFPMSFSISDIFKSNLRVLVGFVAMWVEVEISGEICAPIK